MINNNISGLTILCENKSDSICLNKWVYLGLLWLVSQIIFNFEYMSKWFSGHVSFMYVYDMKCKIKAKKQMCLN